MQDFLAPRWKVLENSCFDFPVIWFLLLEETNRRAQENLIPFPCYELFIGKKDIILQYSFEYHSEKCKNPPKLVSNPVQPYADNALQIFIF